MAVCSILYQLATRPEQQEKLYQELKRVLPDPSEPLNAQKLDQMHFLRAFVKEVFRYKKNTIKITKTYLSFNVFRQYSTVIGNGRTLQQDMVIQGYKIPKGVRYFN